MIKLQKILVPIDFSEKSLHAFRYGREFAVRFQTELHLLHVMQDLVAVVPEPGLAFAPQGDYMRDLRVSTEKAMREFIDDHAPQGVQIVQELREGPPFVEIIRYAREAEIDLIVMGTHGRTGLAHVLLGSVAEKVVRKANCPILTVRHPEHEFIAP